MIARRPWALVAVAAAGSVGELIRRRRSARQAPPPPITTQSSPGQIADLQQAYGAETPPDEAARAG